MAEQFSNHPGTTLSAAITSTTRPVTFTVASATNLPTSGNFRVLVDSEILLITTVSGTSLTGSNVEGTTAATHANGATVQHVLTAGALAQVETDAQNTLLASNAAFTGNPTFSGTVGIGGAARQQLSLGLYLDLYSATASNSPTVSSVRGAPGGALAVSGAGSGSVYLAWDSGTGGVIFGNGASSPVASVNSAGLLTCASLTVNNGVNISFGSNWQNFTPTFTASGSMTVSSPSGNAQFIRIGPVVHFYLAYSVTLGGALSNTIIIGLPVNGVNVTVNPCASAISSPTTAFSLSFCYVAGGNSNQLVCYINNGSNYPVAGTYTFYISGTYRCA